MKPLAKIITILLVAIGFEITPGLAGEEFYYGIQTHFAQGKGEANLLYGLIKQAGFNSLRDELYWQSIEKRKGDIRLPGAYERYLDRALADGIIPLVILAYGNPLYGGRGTYPQNEEALEGFARYCEYVVSRYKGRIPVYEIWNEWGGIPDPRSGPGTARDYEKLLAHVVPRLGKIDPDAKFIAGWRDPMSSRSPRWLEEFLEAGGLRHLDGYSVHPYGFRETHTRPPEHFVVRMRKLQELLKSYNDGREVPVYVTEIGWPTHAGKSGMHPEAQAATASRIFILARTLPFIRGLWFYDLQDDGYNPEIDEHNFGLLRPDGTPKPGYSGAAETVKALRNLTFVTRRETGDAHIWLLEFQDREGNPVWVAWSADQTHQHQILFETETVLPDAWLDVTPAGRPAWRIPFGYREWTTAESRLRREARPDPKQASLTLNNTPLFVRGPLASLRVTRVIKHRFPASDSPSNQGTKFPDEIAAATRIHAADDVFWAGLSTGRVPPGTALLEFPGSGRPESGGAKARFAAFYSTDTLFLRMEVEDTVHCQTERGPLTWQGDSLQVGLQGHPLGHAATNAGFTDLCIALTPGGPEVFRHAAEGGEPSGLMTGTDVKAAILRQGDRTTYALALPVEAIGLPYLRPKGHIGLSLLINNNDGKGRKHLGWGGGIAEGKNPEAYNWLTFLP
ncbi:MAG: hypothetical protein LBK99_01050 [Opitutaceae bacterium]|jgi:hypothetical protein|nr:hypothetical protein [Opitutaceae bacterium]